MTLEPIVKKLHVDLEPDAAFDLFTKRIGDWWPVEQFSISAEQGLVPKSVTFVGGVGSEIVEIAADGNWHIWGTVQEWMPGQAFVTTWHPGRAKTQATLLRVTFEPDTGGTCVTLTHSSWEVLGEDCADTRGGYDSGWTRVLARFETMATDRTQA